MKEQKLAEIAEYQKQLIDIGNYNYYQSAIDVFFYPSERLNIRLQTDLQTLRAELLEDQKTNPPFVKITITKYSDRLTEILNYYIGEGKFLGRPYPHIGKKLIKNSTEIIQILESLKNKLTNIVLEPETIEETLKYFERVDKLLTENIRLSKAIIKDISKRMTAINIRLDRDYTKYTLKNESL
ncbi:hypothetical protein MmiEs2_01620 [Methanimicrococcus stummii]|uniref:Uncharacterized protein n=1 Tax=Methanimicrococcus stummii TaxID=3028294 RepID=A0AA96ZYC1_9EURY|nr:hypothetical protein [Methanimicrococcus sp. Es2]WNY27982.1 hypothetical protein MmiEs2_01620 [Methanimicrococcus sp. Es2]